MHTDISSLGEFGLIHHLTKNIELQNASSIVGVGDDAAVIDSEGLLTLVSTDMLVEGVHFDLAYCPIKHLGYKAVVVNVSDIYAMNGLAKQITVSIALSNRFSVEAIQEFYEGVHLACDHYEVDLVGGDTSSSHSGLIISVTAIGVAKPSAHGHAMISTDTAATRPLASPGAGPNAAQTMKASTAMAITAGTNQPDT